MGLKIQVSEKITRKLRHLNVLSTQASSNCNKHNNAANTSTLSVAQIKPIMKVSFRKKLSEVKQCAADLKITEAKDMMVVNAVSKKQPPNSLLITKSHHIEERDATAEDDTSGKSHKPIATISNKIDKPPPAKISALSDLDTPTKPWSKLKIATLSSSYTSLATSCTSSEDVHSPVRNRSLENIKNDILNQKKPKCCEPLTYSTRRKLMNNASKMEHRLKVQSLNRAKFYQSVFDLSPEYKRLPFVKRLKILNERQKIAELEKDLQVRSFSLDDPNLISCLPPTGKIYRCQSDMSGINTQTLLAYDSSSTTSTNTSTSENSKRISYCIGRNSFNILEQNYLPLSPDNNEPEQRHLKSILMKFNKTTDRQKQLEINEQPSEITYESLQPSGVYSREPTLEGYVLKRKIRLENDKSLYCMRISQEDLRKILSTVLKGLLWSLVFFLFYFTCTQGTVLISPPVWLMLLPQKQNTYITFIPTAAA